jgi:hypothetical protein
MGNNNAQGSSSFVCYNCNAKNYFDKGKYVGLKAGDNPSGTKSSGHKVKEVSIECTSCREINSVKIEY